MQKNTDYFIMWCLKCGAKHGISPNDPDPHCIYCNGQLDFEPKKVSHATPE